MASTADPKGSLATALAHAQRLLARDPAMAVEQLSEILKVVPGHATALRLLGEAFAVTGESASAIDALRRATLRAPGDAEAWRLLSEQLLLTGDNRGADAAVAAMLKASTASPQLIEAALALGDSRLAVAEAGLRARLAVQPTDVAALRMLAEVAGRLGRYPDAERLLVQALALAPGFAAARSNLAQVLHRQGKPAEALAELDRLDQRDPRNPAHRTLRAAVLARIGDTQAALELYAAVLQEFPRQPKAWMSYGHALKTVGRVAESIAAYRTAITQLPSLGEAWWSLANLKTLRFTSNDMMAMQTELQRDKIALEDCYHMHFALGKALEDAADYVTSFEHYVQGNALRRTELRYDAAEVSIHLQRSRALYTPEYFANRTSAGSPARDPIFIVGLPRSGSTLLEQILSSHSSVEGTSELPDIIAIAGRLGGRPGHGTPSRYPDCLATLDAAALTALGEEYLERTRIQRHSDRPYFIDKMPNNFQHIGLIQLILPNAKIIDARRHPLGCGFSGFKQHFARGQGFTYDLGDIGRYYRDYVALLAHFDAVLPGRIHRVFYEDMVGDPEATIRALLAYCELPFEAACLSFHSNDRAVRTPSAEQVRQPIYTSAVEHWQHYASMLGPLRHTLGSVLDSYPALPPDMTN